MYIRNGCALSDRMDVSIRRQLVSTEWMSVRRTDVSIQKGCARSNQTNVSVRNGCAHSDRTDVSTLKGFLRIPI